MSETIRRPNVLIFMTDQQNGSTVVPGARPRAVTPHLDAFRERAVTFRDAFATAPHCSPSRASFFTGTYPSEHGVWNNVNVGNALARHPRPEVPFWSRSFESEQYQLAFCGKWHVSSMATPRAYGWTELNSGDDFGLGTTLPSPLDGEIVRNHAREQEIDRLRRGSGLDEDRKRGAGEIIRPGWPAFTLYGTEELPFGDEGVVSAAEGFIANQKRESPPWVLYVGTLGPHDPYTPPARFLDLYDPDDIELPPSFDDPMIDKPTLYRRTRDAFDQLSEGEHREALRHYLAFCSYEDELFGRLIDAVDKTSATENTVILYVSDHGDYAGDHGLWGKGLPSFQSAYRVPLIIGGPGVSSAVQGTVRAERVSLVDLGPTLQELCGLAVDRKSSGRSLVPILEGVDETASRRQVIYQSNGNEAYGIQRVVIHDQWKLVVNLFDDDELYNLDVDPDEQVNLLGKRDSARRTGVAPASRVPEDVLPRVRDLYARLWRFALAHDDAILDDYILTALETFGPGSALEDS
ncbi:sulfatase-like hydrolase/transferase [Glaciihabitans sp. UYNi722]|uniref:sulfatase-like hydrolase/transferase n=1 Tax=Glaciihabitans sp. UYNi722 TaxID=3156344 RepID=UPI0033949CBB